MIERNQLLYNTAINRLQCHVVISGLVKHTDVCMYVCML